LFGRAFAELINKTTSHVVFSAYNKHIIEGKNTIFLDITDEKMVRKTIKELTPDVIVHAAAFTNVDKCETEQKTAFEINANGTKNIATGAYDVHAKLVSISTDYVFDGEKGNYRENDKTNPVNYYGLTKLEGEKMVMHHCDNFVIARTSVVYGSHKKNFATWMIEELKQENPIHIVTDQWVSPTLNLDLAEQVLALIEKDKTGIFHTAGAERISRYDFALKLAEVFDFDYSLIRPATASNMNWIAKRPVDSSLDVTKISNIKKPYTVSEALKNLKEELA